MIFHLTTFLLVSGYKKAAIDAIGKMDDNLEFINKCLDKND